MYPCLPAAFLLVLLQRGPCFTLCSSHILPVSFHTCRAVIPVAVGIPLWVVRYQVGGLKIVLLSFWPGFKWLTLVWYASIRNGKSDYHFLGGEVKILEKNCCKHVAFVFSRRSRICWDSDCLWMSRVVS